MKRTKTISFDSEWFARKFSSEAALQQVIAGLLTRMPDISGVQVLQGPQEYGKDLVFSIRGGFGESILCACVVKNIRITGTVGSSKGARTILFQAEQAFDTPHLDDSGRQAKVERVYIVTPFQLPSQTIRSIEGKLATLAGQVQFISGSQLFDLFKRYWPSVLADEFTAMNSYLSAVKEEVSEERALSNLMFQYQLGAVDKNFTNVYVSPLFYADLRSYSIAASLTTSIPSDVEISRPVTFSGVESKTVNLRRLQSVSDALADWDYMSKGECDSLNRTAEQLCSLLPARWEAGRSRFLAEAARTALADRKLADGSTKRSVQRARAARERLISRIKEDAKEKADQEIKMSGVLLGGIPDVVHEATVLRLQLGVALARLDQMLQGIQGFVSNVNVEDDGWICAPEFPHCCRFNEFVKQGPTSFFAVSQQKRVLITSEVVSRKARLLLILGPAGFGKTSFCRWHALRDAEAFSTGASDVLPVYIALHKLSAGLVGSLRATVRKLAGQSALSTTRKGHSMAAQKVRLYLDGLDEIPSAARRQEIVAHAKETSEQDPAIQVVITAREYVYRDGALELPALRLAEFNQEQTVQLVSRWLNSQELEREFHNQLKVTGTLAPLMRIPLMATLTLLVFRQTHRLPENRTRLYEMFVDLLSGGWDLAKGVQRGSSFGSVVKLMVLRRLAAKMHLGGVRQCGQVDLKYTIRSLLSESIADQWEDLEQDLLQDGLMTKVGTAYEFSHFSFQEFLTARDLLGDPRSRRAEAILTKFLKGDDWWGEVLCFYAGLAGKPSEFSEWLTTARSQVWADERAVARCEALIQAIASGFPMPPTSGRGTASVKNQK